MTTIERRTDGRDLARQVFTVVAFVATVTINGLANALPINGLATGEISDRFDVYFVPAGYVFSIWGLIYIGLILFAIYHLTPLSSMYRAFWQFAISQLVSSTLIGLVWGYAYVKRGYESAVLAHTFSDWIPVVLFQAA